MAEQTSSPGPSDPAPTDHFETSYLSGRAPWDIGRPQPAFAELATTGALAGRVLDVGCGTGEHALLAASLGHPVIGVDLAKTAIARAKLKAAQRGLVVDFLVFDALRLAGLGERFETTLDCGLFHTFDDQQRARFVLSLAAVVPAGGRYHMLCFSEREPGDWGPRRVTRAEIRASFAEGWAVDSIVAAGMELTGEPGAVQGWLVSATRI